jgi:DNA-binding PadR family transcriptional regulator
METKYQMMKTDQLLLYLIDHKPHLTKKGIKRDMMDKPQPPYNPKEEGKMDYLIKKLEGSKLIEKTKEKNKYYYTITGKGKNFLDEKFIELKAKAPEELAQWQYFVGM